MNRLKDLPTWLLLAAVYILLGAGATVLAGGLVHLVRHGL